MPHIPGQRRPIPVLKLIQPVKLLSPLMQRSGRVFSFDRIDLELLNPLMQRLRLCQVPSHRPRKHVMTMQLPISLVWLQLMGLP